MSFSKTGKGPKIFYVVSVELDLAREGSKLDLNKRKKIRCTQTGGNMYVLVAKL